MMMVYQLLVLEHIPAAAKLHTILCHEQSHAAVQVCPACPSRQQLAASMSQAELTATLQGERNSLIDNCV